MARKKMDLNLDLTMDLNFAVGKKGIALLEVAVNPNEDEHKNASGVTCEGGAKRPLVGCFTRCVFVFVFVSIYV